MKVGFWLSGDPPASALQDGGWGWGVWGLSKWEPPPWPSPALLRWGSAYSPAVLARGQEPPVLGRPWVAPVLGLMEQGLKRVSPAPQSHPWPHVEGKEGPWHWTLTQLPDCTGKLCFWLNLWRSAPGSLAKATVTCVVGSLSRCWDLGWGGRCSEMT